MNGMKRLHGNHFNFHPETFVLPTERDLLTRYINNDHLAARSRAETRGRTLSEYEYEQSSLWIMKPCASSCGKGIKVVTGHQAMANASAVGSGSKAAASAKKYLYQRYLRSPYLIDGKKFDLRIYVLVAGVDPLRVYVHREGLTRISTVNYSLKNIKNRFAHLTNYSINKKSKDFKAAELQLDSLNTTTADEASGGSGDTPSSNSAEAAGRIDRDRDGFKWSLATFREWLAEKESPEIMQETFRRINDLCVKTMIAGESEITPQVHQVTNFRSNCFELFGCDVMLDADLNPHLIEVNVSPSLMGSSPLDKHIKGTLVADMFHIVGIYPHDAAILRKFNCTDSTTTCDDSRLFNVHSYEKLKNKKPLRPSSAKGSRMASQKPTSFRLSSSSKGDKKKKSESLDCKEVGEGDGDSHAGDIWKDLNVNPFAFFSLSKVLSQQSKWRSEPSPDSINLSAFQENDPAWTMMLMCEDEFARARSSYFECIHPAPSTVKHYLSLYRHDRFADHLLAKWVLCGGFASLASVIPSRYLRPADLAMVTELRQKRLANQREKKLNRRRRSLMDSGYMVDSYAGGRREDIFKGLSSQVMLDFGDKMHITTKPSAMGKGREVTSVKPSTMKSTDMQRRTDLNVPRGEETALEFSLSGGCQPSADTLASTPPSTYSKSNYVSKCNFNSVGSIQYESAEVAQVIGGSAIARAIPNSGKGNGDGTYNISAEELRYKAMGEYEGRSRCDGIADMGGKPPMRSRSDSRTRAGQRSRPRSSGTRQREPRDSVRPRAFEELADLTIGTDIDDARIHCIRPLPRLRKS
jgi:hypothetical protein